MNKILVFLLFISSAVQAQNINFSTLEKEIYRNNQQGRHDQSQKILLEILDDKKITLKEEVSVNFLLANPFAA